MFNIKNLAKKINTNPEKVAVILGPDIVKYDESKSFFDASLLDIF